VKSFQLRVLNGTDRAGLAHDVAAQLRRRGFRIAGVGNAKHVRRTEVRYVVSDEAAARGRDPGGPPDRVAVPGVVGFLGWRAWPGCAHSSSTTAAC
jgi:hypothetical protein